jgi:hypothetical protein
VYPQDEQETIIIYEPQNKRWKAYSCYPAHMSKLTKQAGQPFKIDLDKNGKMVAGTWYLTKRQVSILSPNKPKVNSTSQNQFFGRNSSVYIDVQGVQNQSE